MKECNLDKIKAVSAILESMACAGSGIKYTDKAMKLLSEVLYCVADEEENLES